MPASPCGGAGAPGMGMPPMGAPPMVGMGGKGGLKIEGKGGPGGPMPLGQNPNPFATMSPYGMHGRFTPTFSQFTTGRWNHQPTAGLNRLNQGLKQALNAPEPVNPAAAPDAQAAAPEAVAPEPAAAPPAAGPMDDSIAAAPQTADPAVPAAAPADVPMVKKLKKSAKKVKKSKKKHH